MEKFQKFRENKRSSDSRKQNDKEERPWIDTFHNLADGRPPEPLRIQHKTSPQNWNYNPRDGSRSSWHLPYGDASMVDGEDMNRSQSVGRTDPRDMDVRSTSSRVWHTDDDRHMSENPGEQRKRRRESPRVDTRAVEKFPREDSGTIRVKDLKQIPEFEERPLEVVVNPHPRHQHFPEDQGNGEEATDPIIMVIVDDGNQPTREISKANKTVIENKLTRRLLKAAREGKVVQFETQEYDGKHWKYACANPETCEWLKEAIGSISKIWKGASLNVIPEKELTPLCPVSTFVPGLNLAQESCLTALAGQNPKLGISKWMINKFERNDELGGYKLLFGVPDEFLPEIKACRGKAYFMFSKIILKIIDNAKKKSKRSLEAAGLPEAPTDI
ncbi:hypothetical protein DMENIID0001_152800 [Sergentomyia squamirostris]